METHERECLIAEYAAAHSSVLHYDSFRWSAGSMLIAGVFLFWGVIFTNDATEELFGPASIVVALVMSIWLLYANHYRQLYLCKLHRIWEVETLLDMRANLGFVEGGPVEPHYRASGLKGHSLDSALFGLVSLSGPFLASFRQGWRWWMIVPAAIVLAVVVVVEVQEKSNFVRIRAIDGD